MDLPEHFDGNDSTSVYYDRLFSASPYAVFHVTEDMGNAAGIGQELSIRVVKRVYAKVQIAKVYLLVFLTFPPKLPHESNHQNPIRNSRSS
ncbi:MAG: hypothetical protein ACJAZ2_000059 [Glaciecola sp.]